MAPRLIGWGVLALIGWAIWAVLTPVLRWLAFGIYWKINDSDYRRDMAGTSFSQRWEAARADWADLAGGGLDGALSVLAAVAALRLVIVLRNTWTAAGEKTGDACLTGAWERGAAIERLFPPPATSGLSHLGGLPIACPGFIWPRGPNGVPNFSAQIDMADLPDVPTRALFPATGLLHFFLPSLEGSSFNARDVGPLVAYSPDDNPLAQVSPPADLSAHGDGTTTRRSRWPLRLRQQAHGLARGALYPYHPVTLRPVGRGDRPSPPPLPDLPDRAGAAAQRARWKEAERWRAGDLIGPLRSEKSAAWEPPLDRVWRPDPGFPSDWLQIDALACAERGVAEGTAPSAAETEAFWSLIRDIAEARIAACHWPIGPLASGVLRNADRSIRDAMAHAAEERLAARQPQPDALTAALAQRHTPGARGENGEVHGNHRIGGAPDVVQDAAEMMIHTHVLLLQLGHDDPMGFRFGDVGVFQWWIKPDDLAAHRWNKVELIFEGH